LIIFIFDFLLLHFLEILNALKRFIDDVQSFVTDKLNFILGEEVWTYLIEYALECSDLSVKTFCVLLVLDCLHQVRIEVFRHHLDLRSYPVHLLGALDKSRQG